MALDFASTFIHLYKTSLSQILLFRLTQKLCYFEVWTTGTAISRQRGLIVCIQVRLLMCFLYKCTATKVFPRTVNYWKLLYSYTPEQNYREQYKTTHTLHKQKQINTTLQIPTKKTVRSGIEINYSRQY